MKRSLPWAAFAFCPFVILALAINGPGIGEYFAGNSNVSPFAQFMLKYWWFVIGFTVLLHALSFAAIAIANRAQPVSRRVLWSLAMIFGLPFVVPVYWWLHSEPSQFHRQAA
jgi:hypothetical protein